MLQPQQADKKTPWPGETTLQTKLYGPWQKLERTAPFIMTAGLALWPANKMRKNTYLVLYCEPMFSTYKPPWISDSNKGYFPSSWNIMTFFTEDPYRYQCLVHFSCLAVPIVSDVCWCTIYQAHSTFMSACSYLEKLQERVLLQWLLIPIALKAQGK